MDGSDDTLTAEEVQDRRREQHLLDEAEKERNSRRTTHNDIIEKALSIKRNLSYNNTPTEAAAKHIINELCHRFGDTIVKVKHESNGGGGPKVWFIISLFGRRREMTWFEVRMWKWFGWPPKGAILDE
jgi:hypothetical protein